MKRCFYIFILIMFAFPASAQNSLWKQVEDLEAQSLPKSALETVDQIYQNALKTGNSPELVKAMIYQLKYSQEIDHDQLPDRIREVEQFAATDKNPVEQAVLYSLLASIYCNYYQADAYKINQRTDLIGDTPEDIREWSSNLFTLKITELVNASLLPAKELQHTALPDYAMLLTGIDNLALQPALYDFLIERTIKIFRDLNRNKTQYNETISALYRQWLDFRNRDNNPKALLMVELEHLDFEKQSRQISGEEYLNALQTLEKQYQKEGLCVEILYKEALYYQQNVEHDEEVGKIYGICTEGIKQYPDYERINLLKNLLNEITQSRLEVSSNNVVYPGKELKLQVNYRNINEITIEIYQIKAPVTVYNNNWQREGQYKKSGTLVEVRKVTLINRLPYSDESRVVSIPVQDLGNYEYVAYSGAIQEKANSQFSVSRLATVSRVVDNHPEFLVVDRVSGKPLADAEIRFYTRKNNLPVLDKAKNLLTNEQGLAVGKNEPNMDYFYNAVYKNDTALILSPQPWISTYRESEQNTIRIDLFTDRSIYRPGQTVYFKGIVSETGKNVQRVVSGKTYTLTFRDANNKEIAVQKLTTNEWGSFAGEFTIPQGALSGNFSIQTDNGYRTIKVEEYKRPTFDIRCDKNESSYRLGDEVTVKGNVRTFSGVNLQDATVKYTVSRQSHWLYRMGYFPPTQIAEGTVQTQTDGTFNIRFTADKALKDLDKTAVYYTYIIEATVTAANGESQNSQTSIYVGDKSMYLTVYGLNEVMDKTAAASISVNTLNLSGNPVPGQGTYEIYSLQAKDKTRLDLTNEDWMQDKKVLSGNFESGKKLEINSFKSFHSGRYRLVAKAKDQQGREVETQQDFTLTSEADQRPPVPVYEWLMPIQTTCAPGEKAALVYGSSAKEVYVLYEIFKDNQKISGSRFVLNNENRKIEIPFLEAYGEGIVVMLSFVKDEKFFHREIKIERKQEDKTLTLKMEVFRDYLLPGEREEWKLSVKDAAQQPVFAELLAGMYDASLDKLYAHSWNFNPVRPIRIWTPSIQTGNDFGGVYISVEQALKSLRVPSLDYPDFNWFGFSIVPRNGRILFTGAMMKSAAGAMDERGVDIADLQEHKVVVQEEKPAIFSHINTYTGSAAAEVQQEPDIQVRQNFAETAFFYPQLKTNEAGETLISFTVPESNTTWKFRSLAHTKDLQFGQIVKEAVSQKKLMVTPNIPRFMREGDRMTFTSSISNLSDENLSGTVGLECFDPVTNRTNIEIAGFSQSFSVEAGKTVAVSWTFDIPKGIELTALKIVAQSENFSDGEQHLIPVLPNRMLVTESFPLDVSGRQTRTFSFDKMTKNTSPTLEDYRLTLEFTGNPTWYAVQALPTVTAPRTDDVLSWFAVYYSNTLATQIANSTPKIKQMIEVWNAAKTSDAVEMGRAASLQKNQELKAILLEETPWVLAAENEAEQKQRLALLFDINRSNNLTAQALDKLNSLQAEDGGWSWYKGMAGNVSITQWILYGWGKIYGDAQTPELDNMIINAVQFIDRKFREHYEDFKKHNPNWKQSQALSGYELEYLYVRSFYRDIPLDKTQEAAQFYTGLVEKQWAKSSNLYHYALAAMVMQRNNNPKTAQVILKSLRERASHKADFGMYWANNSNSCFMTQSAVCVHTFIMEAFREVGSTPAEMDEMKLWLLKQKQTQEWESVPATVNAIQILLETGGNWLESEGKVSVKWGAGALDFAGAGYHQKEALKGFKAFKENPEITVAKQDPGPAWGALYWQYFEDLDKITAAKTSLNVEKSLIAANNPLKVGDKITVRLTVRADRDMEYVLLKDLRASCLEPVNQLSGIQWKQELVYYQSPKDASVNFFFQSMPKGTYVFEYELYVNAPGDYSNGMATVQCLYAPEFVSHTAGGRIQVK